MTIDFNTHGNDKQLEVAKLWTDDETIDIAYGGSKGSGKSYLGVSLIFGDALIYPGTHYFIARKELNDLRKHTKTSIKEVLDGWGLKEGVYWTYNGQDNFYELYNGSKVFFFAAAYMPSDDKYERFGSIQMTRGWIEEVGEIDEKAKNALQATIGRWKNDEYGLKAKLLLTLNPSKNFVYEKYYLANKENRMPAHRKFVQALPTDNKKLPRDYIANLLLTLDENEIQRLVYGNWEYDDNPYTLHDYDKICNMFTNDHVKAAGSKYLTGDIAYLGSDLFVIYIWHGWRIIKVIAIDKIDETRIGAKFIELAHEYGIPWSNIAYDADGLRKFTAQSLSKLETAKAFRNNAPAIKDPQYSNLKTECAFILQEKLEEGAIYCEDQTYRKQMIADFEQVRREPKDDELKIKLESKKKYKLRTNRSLDYYDGALIRGIFELNKLPQWD